MRVIDSHTHVGIFPLFNVKINADEMIEIMDKYNIQKALVMTLPNELTLKAVNRYPNRLVGIVWVNPYDGDRAIKLISEAIDKWKFKGIKLHPLLHSFLPDQEVVFPIMDIASKYRLPVQFHCGHPPWSLPWHFGNLAEMYPDVKIILVHMGHGHIVYINGAIEIAKKHQNVYLETSAMPMHAKIKEAVDKVGRERVIYGSDMPFGHPAFEIEKVKVSGLKEEELEYVFYKNVIKLYNIT